MNALKYAWLMAGALVLSGCAGPAMRPPTALPVSSISITTVAQVPASGQLPAPAAHVGTSQYIVMQNEGGSIFLGPILGGLRVESKTREMAEKYKHSVFDIDPMPTVAAALSEAGMPDRGASATYTVHPYVYVEHGTDGRFRMALVYQVESHGAQPWIGRYTYDLPTPIAEARFMKLDDAARATFNTELNEGAAALASLMQRDLSGALPKQGRAVNVGTLWLCGERFGGIGIYTQPAEMSFQGQILEESGGFVTVRMDALLGPNQVYGVHLVRRDLVHTLKSRT
jgi:hypothetical protein